MACSDTKAPKKPAKKATQGGGRAKGNADADRGQEAGEGNRGEEAGRRVAAEVGLGIALLLWLAMTD